MSKTILVNVSTKVNQSEIRRETRNGRNTIVVPSATMPDNIVMNGILYPADKIRESFQTLDRTFAPLGHPMIGNSFISAREPEAINGHHVGAHNENVRHENGRVFLDKVIDVDVANRTEDGQKLIEAINQGDPIHTSTGIFVELEPVEGEDYDYIANSMVFDHDAILMDEPGAATPEQGVGMMVNSTGNNQEIPVHSATMDRTGKPIKSNQEGSMLDLEQRIRAAIADIMQGAEWTWLADWGMDWAIIEADSEYFRVEWSEAESGDIEITGDPEPVKRVTVWESIQNAARRLFNRGSNAAGSNTNHSEDDDMSELTKDDVKGIVNDALKANADNHSKALTDTVTEAIKPLQEKVDSLEANAKAKEEAEKAELVQKVVKANMLTEPAAKELTTNALRELAAKAEPGKAAGINGAFAGNQGEEDQWSGYDLNPDDAGNGKEAH